MILHTQHLHKKHGGPVHCVSVGCGGIGAFKFVYWFYLFGKFSFYIIYQIHTVVYNKSEKKNHALKYTILINCTNRFARFENILEQLEIYQVRNFSMSRQLYTHTYVFLQTKQKTSIYCGIFKTSIWRSRRNSFKHPVYSLSLN